MHEVETMMYAGETPWHGLGEQLQDEEKHDWAAAMRRAGLDWEATKVQLITIDQQEIVDRFAVRRLSDGRLLGNVGPDYTILQNAQAFEWFRPFVESGEAEFHTAGSLRGGSRVWALAKLNRKPLEISSGDFVEKFLLLSHSHDGTLAVRIGFTPVRVVCMNTLCMAHSADESALIRFKHTPSLNKNLDQIRNVVNLADAAFEATAEQYRMLAQTAISQDDLKRYVKIVLGYDGTEDLPTRTQHTADRIEELVSVGRGSEGARDTFWGAYNGVTEYLGYEAGRSQDTRLSSLWFGANAKVNDKALDVALTMAKAA